MKAVLCCCVLVLVVAACAPGPTPAEPDNQERSIQITLPPVEDTPTSVPQPTRTPRPSATHRPTHTPVIVTTAPPSAALKPANTQKPAATAIPTKKPEQKKQQSTKTVAAQKGNCSPAYPGVCIPPPPPDLDCKDIKFKRFKVLRPDPHNFDRDGDGVGCES